MNEIGNWPAQRVAVFGGSGFIGKVLCRRLVECGAEVFAFSRNPDQTASSSSGYLQQYANLEDAESVRNAIRASNPTVVYHIASHSDRAECFDQMKVCATNIIQGTLNLLEAASPFAPVFVYGDSTKVFGNSPVPFHGRTPAQPNSSYAIAKSAAWNFCELTFRMTGMPIVGLRPTFVYGPGQGMNLLTYLEQCVRKQQRLIRLQGGKQTRDLLFVEDAVEAFLQAPLYSHNWGRSIVIGSGEERSVEELAREILAVLGSEAKIECSEEDARLTEIWRMKAELSESRELLQWQPRFSLREGLEQTFRIPLPRPALDLDLALSNTSGA